MFAFTLPESVAKVQRTLVQTDWIFSMQHVKRGWCKYQTKEIVLPSWIRTRTPEYQIWYLCHEMAHALAGSSAKHGPQFMAVLKDICPATSVGFETEYKPRNALAAGIVHIAEDF